MTTPTTVPGARGWFRQRVLEHCGGLFHWAEALLDTILALSQSGMSPTPAGPLEWQLRNALDAPAAFGIDVADWISPRALRWHVETAWRFR